MQFRRVSSTSDATGITAPLLDLPAAAPRLGPTVAAKGYSDDVRNWNTEKRVIRHL